MFSSANIHEISASAGRIGREGNVIAPQEAGRSLFLPNMLVGTCTLARANVLVARSRIAVEGAAKRSVRG
jgi:hypothetical protein